MPHVFVETNWLVDCCAPAHNQVPAAIDLLRRAREGEIQVHLPSICLGEARNPLHKRFQTRLEADRVRRYLTWALAQGSVTREDVTIARRIIDQMEGVVTADLGNMATTLRNFSESPGLEVFRYDEAMMDRAVQYALTMPEIKPFDQAILAAVIVRAERLLGEGEAELFFCELDSDLQPWDRNGDRLDRVADIYDAANIWVCSDYLLQNPRIPAGWHHGRR